MADTRETLLDWLRDAYGMERMASETLEKQARRLESYPEMQARVQQHLEETKWQADQVKMSIERLGGSTSSLKSSIGSLMGNIGAMFNSGTPDEAVKDAIGNFAIENFEIASYRSLIAAAQQLGETEIQGVCEQILQQEVQMANWLEQNLPMITQKFLMREEAGVQAKR